MLERTRILRLILCAWALMTLVLGAGRIGAPPASSEPIGDSNSTILVKFRPSARASEATWLSAATGARPAGDIPALGVKRLTVPTGQAEASAAAYRRSGAVEFAEVDGQMTTQFSPNDPYYASAYPTSRYGTIAQWAPQSISAPAAWDTTMGDPAIKIAIVDTGIDTRHPDLQGKISGGTSFIGNVTDQNGHGTHVAGIAAAATNNGTGIAGICPRCSIMPVRALDANGSGLLSDVAAGIIYAADNGARVINLSLGGPTTSQTLRAAIDYAFAHNALPVAAMGNGYAPEALEPAYWYNALAVGAVDQSGARADFSNYGARTGVAAPGVALLSTMPTYQVTLNHSYKQGYDALSGTSMATPVVSGLAGLILSRNPGLTAAQVRGIIEASAGDGKSFNSDTGFGVVNAAKAMALAAHTDAVAPSPNVVSPASGATASKAITLQAAPTDNAGVHHVDFVLDGTRAGAPATAGGGGGKRAASTAAWSTAWDSRVQWNGPKTLSAVAVDTAGNRRGQDVPFTVLNAYKSVSWTAHLCNPPRGPCPYYALQAPGATHPAAARITVAATYTRLDGYSNATLWASIFDGWRQQILLNPGTIFDFYPDVRLCGCAKDMIGAGMAGTIRKNGGAEADVQITLTYPD